jgi:hypothetical protein
VGVVLAFTNPSQEKHIQETNIILKKVVNYISSKGLMDNGNSTNQLMGGIGLLFGDNLIDGVTSKFITRKNYIFFSLTNASFDGKDQTIGIGILGNVVIFDEFEKKIKDILEIKKLVSNVDEFKNWYDGTQGENVTWGQYVITSNKDLIIVQKDNQTMGTWKKIGEKQYVRQ